MNNGCAIIHKTEEEADVKLIVFLKHALFIDGGDRI